MCQSEYCNCIDSQITDHMDSRSVSPSKTREYKYAHIHLPCSKLTRWTRSSTKWFSSTMTSWTRVEGRGFSLQHGFTVGFRLEGSSDPLASSGTHSHFYGQLRIRSTLRPLLSATLSDPLSTPSSLHSPLYEWRSWYSDVLLKTRLQPMPQTCSSLFVCIGSVRGQH